MYIILYLNAQIYTNSDIDVYLFDDLTFSFPLKINFSTGNAIAL